ncbi:MAG: hypothetical protein ACOCRK_07455 [bacterium]
MDSKLFNKIDWKTISRSENKIFIITDLVFTPLDMINSETQETLRQNTNIDMSTVFENVLKKV